MFRVQCSASRVPVSGFGIRDSGSEFRVSISGFGFHLPARLKVLSCRFRVSCPAFQVWGVRVVHLWRDHLPWSRRGHLLSSQGAGFREYRAVLGASGDHLAARLDVLPDAPRRVRHDVGQPWCGVGVRRWVTLLNTVRSARASRAGMMSGSPECGVAPNLPYVKLLHISCK